MKFRDSGAKEVRNGVERDERATRSAMSRWRALPLFFSLATSESVDGDANRESILGVEEKRAVCGKKN